MYDNYSLDITITQQGAHPLVVGPELGPYHRGRVTSSTNPPLSLEGQRAGTQRLRWQTHPGAWQLLFLTNNRRLSLEVRRNVAGLMNDTHSEVQTLRSTKGSLELISWQLSIDRVCSTTSTASSTYRGPHGDR